MRNSLFPQKIKMRNEIKKYCILSSIAIISSTIYAFTAMGRQIFDIDWFISGKLNDDIYSITSNILLMIDSVIAINCIYFGFVNNNYSWLINAISIMFCCKCEYNNYKCCGYCKFGLCIKCLQCSHNCCYYMCCHGMHGNEYNNDSTETLVDNNDEPSDIDTDKNSMMLKPSTNSLQHII
eukprot:348244_1